MSTYLLIDFLIIILPLIVSFFPYLSFYKKFPYVLFSIFAGGLFFVTWDIIATMRGDWSFNPEYVMGSPLPACRWKKSCSSLSCHTASCSCMNKLLLSLRIGPFPGNKRQDMQRE